jgi:hypothetical protein
MDLLFGDLTRCVSLLRTPFVTLAGEAASLQWVTASTVASGVISLAYLVIIEPLTQATEAFASVTNGIVTTTPTDGASVPASQANHVCEVVCDLVRGGKIGGAPCFVAANLVGLCTSGISDVLRLTQLAFNQTSNRFLTTVCNAISDGCAPGACPDAGASCDPPCGPNEHCLDSGDPGSLCCRCALDPGKCCQRPVIPGVPWADGTVFTDGCCPANTRCAWTAAGSPGCAALGIQCQFFACTN